MTDPDREVGSGRRILSPRTQPRIRLTVAATLGHLIEYYDYTIYAAMASVLAPLFFTNQSPTGALLSTFALFAVPFIARPVGGAVFGHFGDRLGRKRILVITVSLMGMGCGLIGVLPTYRVVGDYAPALLFLLRLVQGASAGGEIGGATTYVVESAPEHRRGLFGAVLGIGPTAGVALASGCALLVNTALTSEQLTAWGWRLPFLVALPLALIALYMRRRLEDSPAFLDASATHRVSQAPVGLALTRHRATLLRLFGICAAQSIGGYVVTIFVVTYLSHDLGYSRAFASGLTSFGLLALVPLIPLFGALSDRVGRKPVVRTALLGYALLTVPTMLLMGKGEISWTVVAFVVFSLPNVVLQGASFTMYAELFPTNTRFSGLSIAFGGGVMVGGATPFLATLLIQTTGDVLMPGYLVTVGAVVGLCCLHRLRETASAPLTE